MSRNKGKKRLLCILAHPDDESLGTGGILAKYGSEGVSTYVISATRGERGRFGLSKESPGLEIVGNTREQELRSAAEILGVKEVRFLDYIDGDLDQAPTAEAIQKIAKHVRDIKPHVIVTFGSEGAYGHPDHIAISQFTSAAIVVAADSSLHTLHSPHIVQKLYWLSWNKDIWDAYQSVFKRLIVVVDENERQAIPSPDWLITTSVDTKIFWKKVWAAVQCHQTQIAAYSKLEGLSTDQHKVLWGTQTFYRVFSLVNGGRKKESDLFEGIRL